MHCRGQLCSTERLLNDKEQDQSHCATLLGTDEVLFLDWEPDHSSCHDGLNKSEWFFSTLTQKKDRTASELVNTSPLATLTDLTKTVQLGVTCRLLCPPLQNTTAGLHDAEENHHL